MRTVHINPFQFPQENILYIFIKPMEITETVTLALILIGIIALSAFQQKQIKEGYTNYYYPYWWGNWWRRDPRRWDWKDGRRWDWRDRRRWDWRDGRRWDWRNGRRWDSRDRRWDRKDGRRSD